MAARTEAPARRSGRSSGRSAARAAGAGSGDGTRPPGRLARVAVRPDTDGPRVRLGILWFFLAMAAATAGRWSSGVLWAVMAAGAAREVLLAWSTATGGGSSDDAAGDGERPAHWLVWTAAGCAAAVPLAAAAGVGMAGAVLVVVTLLTLGLGRLTRDGGPGMAVTVAVVLPAVAAGAVVLVVAAQLWAGLFLVSAVSLYDAGNYVAAAESSSRLEGPVTGIVGVLAVTFTMATFQAAPFDTTSAWIVGAVVAVACPTGQWVTSAFLPRPDARTPAMRRLDAYVLAAPLFLAGVWAVS